MKKILLLLVFLCQINGFSQGVFPKILTFSESEKTTKSKKYFSFLMLSSNNAIDLKKFGNTFSDFKIIASNASKIILEYNEPSKLILKGRCASGTEKGILLLEFDTNKNLIKNQSWVIESCLLSIESTKKVNQKNNTITYISESFTNSKKFYVVLDLKNISVTKKE